MEAVDKVQGDWFFYTFLICLALLAAQKSFWSKNLIFFYRIFTEFRLRRVEEDLQNTKLFNYMPLYLNYMISLTLVILMFFYVVFETGGLRLDLSSFLRLLIGLMIFLITKNFVQQFLLQSFIASENSEFLNRNFELGNSTVGLISTPLLFISFYTLQYSSVMLWITIASGALLYLYNLSKVAWFMYSVLRLSPFFILVYLCSVEILPVVWITGWMGNKI